MKPLAVLMIAMIRSGPSAFSAHPSSSSTFGLGNALPLSVLPTGVMSATNTADCDIFLRMVAMMSTMPGVFCVSWSTSGRSAS